MERNERGAGSSRASLAEIFRDTQRMFSDDPELSAACAESRRGQRVYAASEDVAVPAPRFDSDAEVVVSRNRSFEAAAVYARAGRRTAVLNFANSFCPGGGVVHGARAQEECLCRTSTLYDALSAPGPMRLFYGPHMDGDDDLGTDDVIFTPGVVVFKSDTAAPEPVPSGERFSVDVLTCAAPDVCGLRDMDGGISDGELGRLHRSRARRILSVAAANRADALVLGAFGCGAFGNPPRVVAAAFRDVLAEFSRSFAAVEFAVYCSARDSENFSVFSEIFG